MISVWSWLLGLPPDALEGADDWAVRLTGLPQNLWVLMGLAVLFAALGFWTLRNYRREGRARRPVKGLLAGLRIAALALLLWICLQPALLVRHRQARRSAVLVLLDDTLSMAWADRYGDASRRTALAAFLDVEKDRLSSDERLTRTEIVRRTLKRRGGAIERLAADHPLHVYRFGHNEGSQYVEQLAVVDTPGSGASAGPEAALTPAIERLSAGGQHTNLARAVRDALGQMEGRRLGGIVVVSDGRSTGRDAARRLAAAAQMARDRGVGLYAVAVGDPRPPKNVKIAQVRGPAEVRKGNTAEFTALLTHRHFEGREVRVELHCSRAGSGQWEKTGAEATIVLGGQDDADAEVGREVVLRTEPAEVGRYTYKAVAAPQAGEMLPDDNAATTSVRVTDQKVAVLLVSGDAGWEFQYLRNYLLKHPEHYKVSVWQQNADPRFNQEASTGMKLGALPMTRDDLFAYDAVVLYDPRYVSGSADAQFIDLLKEFVNTHHGGLCYIPGNKFTDRNLAAGGPLDELAKLLPVKLDHDGVLAAPQAPKTAWPVEPTAEGKTHPLMQLADEFERNEAVWAALPGAFRSQRVRWAKTLATPLAVSGDPARTTEHGQREPVIAVQYYGKGRVLYIGIDSTWLWRRLDAGAAYRRFWANAMNFLAAGRLERKRILITTAEEVYDAGSDIRVRVEAYDRDLSHMDAETFTVRMKPEDGTEPPAEHDLRAVGKGVFEGSIPADRTGAFILTAEPTGREEDVWLPEDVAPRRLEVRLPQTERLRPEADYQALQALAGDPDRFLLVHQIDELPERIPPGKTTQMRETPHPIWNTMLSLVVIGVLLLAEWTVRKLYNMV